MCYHLVQGLKGFPVSMGMRCAANLLGISTTWRVQGASVGIVYTGSYCLTIAENLILITFYYCYYITYVKIN